MSYTFTSDLSLNLTQYLSDGSYNEMKLLLDASLSTIIEKNTISQTDISLINDAYTFKSFLRNKNAVKTNNIMRILSSIPSDLDVQNDYETSKEEYILKEGQNNTTTQTFLERYLFVILKVIFFLLCLFVLFHVSNKNNIKVGNLVNNFKDKLQETKDTTQAVIGKITNNNKEL
jgi:hypothetical protein